MSDEIAELQQKLQMARHTIMEEAAEIAENADAEDDDETIRKIAEALRKAGAEHGKDAP